MRTLFLFFIFSVLVSFKAYSLEFSAIQDLAKDPQWQRLVYYKKSFFSGIESLIDAPAFFNAKDGKINPESELKATFELMQDPLADQIKEENSVFCRFPARVAWIKNKISAKGLRLNLRPPLCPRYQKWFEALRGTSASLVFSSYFLNNPSSTFGHTLLRINKAANQDGKRYELLDYGVNFAANTNTSNPLLYSIKGLFGGFPGTFTTVPYYFKVREYSNSESRDLWEYQLNLTPEVTDMLVAHIWEVGSTYADYWYLSENCSYFMLALLEAADPNIDVTSKLKKYVIPTDTVQVVYASPGLVKSFHFRPSVRTELFTRLIELTEIEKNILAELIEERKFSEKFKKLEIMRRRLVLDAAIDDMDYLYAVAVQKPESPEWKFKNQILIERSQIDEVTSTLVIPAPQQEEPHAGHGSRRLGFGYQNNDQSGNNLLLSYRFAFHDILDPFIGFPEYAQIIFFDLKLAYEEKPKKLELTEFNLFEVLSLSPYNQFSKSLSWRLKVAVEKLVNEDCWGCHALALSGGAGYALKIADDPRLVSYMGLKAAVYSTDRDHRGNNFPRWMLGAGPNLILRARWNEASSTVLEAWYRKDMQVRYNEYKELSLSHQISFGKNNGIRLTGVERWFEHSATIEFFHYY